MRTIKNDNRLHAALCGVLLLVPTELFNQASAEEPQPVCPKCSTAERGIPILSKIPYVSRLFKNVAVEPDQVGEPQKFERIGLDFDFEACQDCPAECLPDNVSGACQQNARPQILVMRRTAHGKLASPCCEGGRCEEGCGEDCEKASACCPDRESAERPGLTWQRWEQLTNTHAALQATLEAQSAFHKEKAEMTDAFVQVLMENARLQAQVETQAKQAEFMKEMLTLVSENARLKAQVESADAKVALVHETARLALENEQLKLALQLANGKGRPYTVDPVEENQTSNRTPVSKPARY